MYAFASIHTALPSSQSDHEGVYPGYKRMPVQCQIGGQYLYISFPEIEQDTDMVMTHVALGSEPDGDGEIFTSIPVLPYIPLKRMDMGVSPRVAILYPADLPTSARIVHQMVSLGMLRTSDMEAKFFEVVNERLEKSGIPILTVRREAAAKWIGKMNQMPALSQWAQQPDESVN